MLPIPQKRFSTKTILIWLAIGFTLFFVALFGCLTYIGEAHLNAQLAELRANGMPTTISELNAFYAKQDDKAEPSDLWGAAMDALQAANVFEGEMYGDFYFLLQDSASIPPPGETWPELNAIRKYLNELAGEILLIREAANSGDTIHFPIDFSAKDETLWQQVEDADAAAWILAIDAYVSAHDGKNAQAFNDLTAIFTLSDTLRAVPTLDSHLRRVDTYETGCDAVVWLVPYCNWSNSELNTLQAMIRSPSFKDECLNGACGSRVLLFDELDQISFSFVRHANKREVLRFFESSIEGLKGTWVDALNQQRELDSHRAILYENQFAHLMLGDVLFSIDLERESIVYSAKGTAKQKCTNIVIAAQRFRQQHGQFPNSLADISQDLLGPLSDPSANVVDPYSGQPLLYKNEAERVVIYSVGVNEKDDGGDIGGDLYYSPMDLGFSLKK